MSAMFKLVGKRLRGMMPGLKPKVTNYILMILPCRNVIWKGFTEQISGSHY